MKLSEFKKAMKKNIFTSTEAHTVAFTDKPELMNLELYQWKKRGELIQLKRGVFMFAGTAPNAADIAKHLCWPCCFSLEYVLNVNNIIPEAVFAYTLVTPKKTRQFKTPFGRFNYHTIQREAFTGFDTRTLMAEPEKALVDYFYLKGARFRRNKIFWEELRLNPENLDFDRIFEYARLFHSKKLILLLTSFHSYAKSSSSHY